MLDMLKQYFKLIGTTLVGIAFGFAFFYLMLNINHYYEIRRNFSFDGSTDKTVVNIKQNLELIRNNINTPVTSEYIGGLSINDITSLKNRFNVCINSINNDAFSNIVNDTVIDIRDVYNFRESYENNVASKCLVNQFIWITGNSPYSTDIIVEDDKELYKIVMNDLINDTEYVKRDLLNNSSYYFSTEISLMNGKNLTRDSFYQVLSSYEKSTAFLLQLSNKYKDAITNVEVQ